MDIINHSAWSYVIADKLDAPLEVSIACAVVGALPDIIGIIGGSYVGKWKLYNWAHRFNFLWFLPPYLLHILMDYPAHIKDKKYWWYCEIVSWIILIFLMIAR